MLPLLLLEITMMEASTPITSILMNLQVLTTIIAPSAFWSLAGYSYITFTTWRSMFIHYKITHNSIFSAKILKIFELWVHFNKVFTPKEVFPLYLF